MRLAILTAASVALMLAFSTSLRAQGRNPIDVFNAERARQRAEAEQRRALEHILDGDIKPTVVDTRQKTMLMAQIKEDFHRIQVINNEMLRTAFTGRTPDYDSLSEKASDLKRRASRLRSIIKLPPPRDEKKKNLNSEAAVDNKAFKVSLVMLRDLIGSFVNNPYFQKKPGVIDVEQSDKASSDLRDIIELCEVIKKSAKRLDRTSR